MSHGELEEVISMLMGSFPAASKAFSPFLSLHRCILASSLLCPYLPFTAVAPEDSILLLLSCYVTFHLSAPVYLFLPFLFGAALLPVKLDEWSRWTVSATSSTGCGEPLQAASHCVFGWFFLFVCFLFQLSHLS